MIFVQGTLSFALFCSYPLMAKGVTTKVTPFAYHILLSYERCPNRRVYFLSLNILKMQQNLHNLQDEEFEILRFFGAE